MSALTEPDSIGADRRRARRTARLPADAVCQLCGIANVDMLTPARVPLLEEHHVLGRVAAPDTTVPLCRNCHAVATGAQHDHDALPPPGRYRTPDTVLERIARALRSLALFVHELAHTLTSYSDHLADVAAALDVALPQWRTQEWAT